MPDSGNLTPSVPGVERGNSRITFSGVSEFLYSSVAVAMVMNRAAMMMRTMVFMTLVGSGMALCSSLCGFTI